MVKDKAIKTNDIPEFIMPAETIWVVKLLADCKMVCTLSDGKRMILEGQVKVNGQKIEDVGLQVEVKDNMILQVGKRKFAIIKKERLNEL